MLWKIDRFVEYPKEISFKTLLMAVTKIYDEFNLVITRCNRK